MARHEVALQGREEIAEGTMAFRFAKPAGFDFKPGQSVNVALLEPPADPNSTRRTLSLASAPFEGDLMVATRMREGSAFKRALKALPLGSHVRLVGPAGTMTLHEDPARAAVFIAGGIGITPFRSMLLQAEHDRLGHRLFLAYSNRRRDQAAFLAELQALERRNDRFRLLSLMTDTDGMLNEERLGGIVADAVKPVYYLAGPPAMVQAMKAILTRNGVGGDDVRSEEFFGY
ncbi:MAG: FAD-dependent oxidoreductase [Burkholderiaceae bacterium]|nr:FAD-dependent oxidoreductase [Burkholderiaceae bacterium]